MFSIQVKNLPKKCNPEQLVKHFETILHRSFHVVDIDFGYDNEVEIQVLKFCLMNLIEQIQFNLDLQRARSIYPQKNSSHS